MPKVPTYDNFQTSVSASPRPTYNAPSLGGAAQIAQRNVTVDRVDAGLGLRQTGRDITQWADGQQQRQDAAYNLQLKAEKEAAQQVDEIRVMDAVNRAKERQYDLTYGQGGYSLQNGINALEREGGQDLASEYSAKFQKHIDDISGTLGSDTQRLMFQKQALTMRTELYGGAERKMAGEIISHGKSVYDGTITSSQRDIATSYGDIAMPSKDNPNGGTVYRATQTIEAAVRKKARLTGESQIEADGQVRKAVSEAHAQALSVALEQGDTAGAAKYLSAFGGQMEVPHFLKAKSAVDKDVELKVADGVASQNVAKVLPRIFNRDDDRLVNITAQAESNGQEYDKKGGILTSPAGAKGKMQVMDATNKDPGYGVKPAQNDSPEERTRVGRDYILALTKHYGGDIAKAWGAYNAGPGRLDREVKDAIKRGQPDAWLSNMPAETQTYVRKNVAAYESGGGKFSAPTLMDVHAGVVADLESKFGPNVKPSVKQAALTRATQQFEDVTKAKKSQEDEYVANAQQALLQNGGKWGDLPPKIRNSVPPGKVDDVMNFGVRISKGNDVTDWSLYYQLSTDSTLLKNTNLMALRDKLAETEFKHLTGVQVKLNEPNPDSYTNLQSAHDVLKGYMKQAGVNPNPKVENKTENEKVGMLTSKFQERLTAREKIEGGKLNPTQINEEAAKLFKPAEIAGTFWNTTKPAGLIGGTDPVKVPKVERDKIVAALTRAGHAADDAVIEDMYRRSLQIPKRTK